MNGRKVKDVIEYLKTLNPNALLMCNGGPNMYFHVEDDGSTTDDDNVSPNERYENVIEHQYSESNWLGALDDSIDYLVDIIHVSNVYEELVGVSDKTSSYYAERLPIIESLEATKILMDEELNFRTGYGRFGIQVKDGIIPRAIWYMEMLSKSDELSPEALSLIDCILMFLRSRAKG